MQKKYKTFLQLIAVIIGSVLVLLLSSCDHVSQKGDLVNHHADIGRSNSYEHFGEFLSYNYYTDTIPKANSAGAIVPPLALSNQELIYATTRGTIMLTTNKDMLWEKFLDSNTAINAYMCADKEQNIYAVSNTGTIYSYSVSGELRWKKQIADTLSDSGIPCDLLAIDDGILAGTTDGVLVKFAFDGKILWKKSFPSGIGRTISANETNPIITIASANENDTLAMLAADGTIKWKAAAGTRLVKYPAINADAICCTGLKYVGTEALAVILVYDLSGKVKWTKELAFVPRYISVADNGDVYANVFQAGIGEQVSAVIRYNKDGKMIWKKYFNLTIPTPVLISKSLLAFMGVTHNAVGLYFVNKETGVIQSIQSYSNEHPTIQSATVRPDGAISFAYYQKIGFIRADEPWINKVLPW